MTRNKKSRNMKKKKQRKRRDTSKENWLFLIATKVTKVMKVMMSLSNKSSSFQKTVKLTFFVWQNIKEMC